MNRAVLGIILLLLILAIAAPLLAQISAHYNLTWHALSGGGGLRSSPHYQLDDVLGLWPDGRSSSTHYQLDPGYWHKGRVIDTHLYFPVIRSPE